MTGVPVGGGEAAAGDERQRRLDDLEALRAAGVDPYPVRFDRTATTAELRERFGDLGAGTETGEEVAVAGRLMLLRRQGGLCFATVRDGSGAVQLLISRAEVGEEQFAVFSRFDRGDWIGARGEVVTTRRGELSVKVASFGLLAKALCPLPEKWHGLSDVEARFRSRAVDLVVNEESRRVLSVRHGAIASVRRSLEGRGFVEVETPVLHPVAGGAAARPFVTHHHALGMDLYLRVAPELYLKRLVVAGYERVFEVGRVFRNEGISTRHNPEFTMLEAYQALADYTDMMVLVEELVAEAARAATGGTVVIVDGGPVDLAPPWRRATLLELIAHHAGVEVHPSMPLAQLTRVCHSLGVPVQAGWGPGKLVLEIYEKTTEGRIAGPTIVTDYPIEVSPLARRHRCDPALAERFEVIVDGRELANAFSELNDPAEQRRRFEAQARLSALGDPEAHGPDEDYLAALEVGLPPCGGLGVGMDRLAMLLAGVSSIREVIAFPHLRPLPGS